MSQQPKSIDPVTQKALDLFLPRIKEKFPEMQGAILFGSRARGDFHEESYVDVAILLDGKENDFLKIKLAMADEAVDVLLKLLETKEKPVLISPTPIWQEEWKARERSEFLSNIAREGVPLR